MKLKYVSLLLLLFSIINSAGAQGILKKIKDKTSGNENNKPVDNNKPKLACAIPAWLTIYITWLTVAL